MTDKQAYQHALEIIRRHKDHPYQFLMAETEIQGILFQLSKEEDDEQIRVLGKRESLGNV